MLTSWEFSLAYSADYAYAYTYACAYALVKTSLKMRFNLALLRLYHIFQCCNNFKSYKCWLLPTLCNLFVTLLLALWVDLIFLYDTNAGSLRIIDARGKGVSRDEHNGIAFANFKAHKFSYLNITSLASVYVLNNRECGLACVNIPSCFSFNLAAFFDITGKIVCELLASDKYNNSDKFVPSISFHHFSVRVSINNLFQQWLSADEHCRVTWSI